MAETKPATTPEWNTGAANRTTPNAAKIILGWALNEAPASSFFNWLGHWCGAGFKWIYERFDDGAKGGGGDQTDLYIHPPAVTSAGGGDLTLGAGDADTVGTGGGLNLYGGDAAGTGSGRTGGTVTVSGGAGADTSGGGPLVIAAGAGGSGGASGGSATLRGGLGGSTNNHGGDTTVSGGWARGNGRSRVKIQAVDANQGSGTDVRLPADYLVADGATKQLTASRTLDVTATSGTGYALKATDSGGYAAQFFGDANNPPEKAAILISPQADTPDDPQKGDVTVHDTTGKPSVYDGNGWGRLVPQVQAAALSSAADQLSGTGGTFATKHTIAAGTLRVGSSIRVSAGGTKGGANGAFDVTIMVRSVTDGTNILPIVTTSGGKLGASADRWSAMGEAVIQAVHATAGKLSGSGVVATDTGESFGYSNYELGTTNTAGVIDILVSASIASGDTLDLLMLRVDVT